MIVNLDLVEQIVASVGRIQLLLPVTMMVVMNVRRAMLLLIAVNVIKTSTELQMELVNVSLNVNLYVTYIRIYMCYSLNCYVTLNPPLTWLYGIQL